jgi:beta-glucuronidase
MSREPSKTELDRRTFLGATGGLALAVAASEVAAAQAAARPRPVTQPDARPTNLYPHASETRATRDLSGVWKFRADPERIGERDGWFKGLQQTRLMPVPCSWNEIFDDLRNYTGGGWYQTDFDVESARQGQRMNLRFGS